MLVLVPPILCFSFPQCVSIGGSEAYFLGSLSTICSTRHGCCNSGAWEIRWINLDSFIVTVLSILFVGRHGPRVQASIVGSLEKVAGVDVLLG